MLRRVGLFLLPIPLGVLLALGANVPVHANTPPGNSALWSVPLSGLATCAAGTGSLTSVGGWDFRDFFASTHSTPGTGLTFPGTLRLRELCDSSSRFSVAYQMSSTTLSIGNAFENRYGETHLRAHRVECINSAGVYVVRSTAVDGLAGGQIVSDPGTRPIESSLSLQNWNAWAATNCARLITVTYSVRVHNGGWQEFFPTWSAARFLGNTGYVYVPPANLVTWCKTNPDRFECVNVLPPNASRWADTCGKVANGTVYGTEYAAFNPVDAATWGPATSWLAACLLVPIPQGGPDRNGVVAKAWDLSPNRLSSMALANVAPAIRVTGGCGVLVSSAGAGPLGPFSINTCTWTWAPPVRNTLGAGVLIGGFLFAAFYMFRAFVSPLVGARLPSPIDRDD